MTKIISTLRRMFQPEHGRAWLMGGVALLVVLLAIQGVKYYWIGRLERTLTGSLEEGVQGPPKRKAAKPQEDYKAIADKGMLGSVEKKTPPKILLWGVLGEEALLGASADSANPFKAGGKLPSGEEVVRIGVNEVVLSKDGKESTLYVHAELKPGKDSKPKPEGPSSPAPPKTGEGGPSTASPGDAPEEPPSDAADDKNDEAAPALDSEAPPRGEAAASDEAKVKAAKEAAEQAAKEAVAEARRLQIMEARER